MQLQFMTQQALLQKPTKLKARNENVKEVSDEQHSLV